MKNFFQSTSGKLLFIGLLILILLIPQAMVRGLVDERQNRYTEAVYEVSSKWGSAQTLSAPTLTVPIQTPIKSFEFDTNGVQTKTNISWKNEEISFEPELTNFRVNLDPNVLNRGIFDILLYQADVNFSGNFAPLVFPDDLNEEAIILWDKAYLSLDISDTKGLASSPKVTWQETLYALKLSEESASIFRDDYGKSMQKFMTKVDLSETSAQEPLNFSANLSIKGSEEFYLFPRGEKTTAVFNSPWAYPSFDGNFLPNNRSISEAGFEADWEISQFVKNTNSYFGVKLIFPVDLYQKNERAVKYGILFIVLTFVTFFLIEVLRSARLHPIQYLLVGFAMILFYVLLLAFSEHVEFVWSYLIASLATTAMITGYCLSALKDKGAASLIGGLLLIIYAYLYVLLQSSDKSLLLGAIFLFGILAAVMFLTRKIDWYEISQKKKTQK